MTTTTVRTAETFAAYEQLKPDLVFGDILPGLAVSPMPYESIRTDVHSVQCTTYAGDRDDRHITIDCTCGDAVSVTYPHDVFGRFSTNPAREEAFALLVEHARTTCALCHGPKPDDTFPRCSGCAF